MIPEIFTVAVKYGSEEMEFSMRMISVEEENQYIDRLLKLSDPTKNGKKDSDAEYKVLVDALASWVYETPTRKHTDLSDEGKSEMRPLEGASASEAVQKYFEGRSPGKERLLNQILNAYRRALVPEVRFL